MPGSRMTEIAAGRLPVAKARYAFASKHWNEGSLRKSDWKSLDKISHPETAKVAAELYLGFGPLKPEGSKAALKFNAAIQVQECNAL